MGMGPRQAERMRLREDRQREQAELVTMDPGWRKQGRRRARSPEKE